MALKTTAVLLLIAALEVNSIDQCTNNKSNRCQCFRGEDIEFQCPPINFNILIHSLPNEYLNIDCNDLDSFDMTLLPKYKAGNNTNVSFRSCPMPENNFIPIFNEFEIYNINRLKLDNVSIPELSNNETISKNVFYGLSDLKDLTISNIFYKLDDDVLEFLPNLLSFDLDHSEINDISTLKFPSSLKVLHITGNFLSDIPIGVFRNLKELYQLHLWGNKIKRIKKGAFDGLKTLISLELSSNDIEDIEEGSFNDLGDLKTINLQSNKLSNIRADTFKYNKNLTSIRMENNPKLILPDYVFANLQKLIIVKLEHSGIKEIPEHLFSGSANINNIILQKNQLKTLPESIFSGLTKLQKLDLSKNELSSLPNNIFSSLTSLKELNLGFNNISEINNELFNHAKNLERLLLHNNKITSIDIDSFHNLGRLSSIDLSNNLYNMYYETGLTPFDNCVNLKEIMLSHNLIETFPEYNVFIYLEEVDLSYNKIKEIPLSQIISLPSENLQSINLRNNEIMAIDFINVDTFSKLNEMMNQINIDLNDNPLSCDCGNFDLVRYCQNDMDTKIKARVNLKVENVYCTKPPMFQHIKISELKPQRISCEIPMKGCPKECLCLWRPYKNFRVIDCSNRNLTTFPKMKLDGKFENIELNLNGNNIQSGLNSSLGYENVKHLFLSNNKLKELKWVPLEIEELTLDQNELTHLEPGLLEIMNKTSLKTLKLSRNPWSCGCSALELQIFIKDNYQKINSTDVICRDDNKPLVEKRELCKSSSTLILLTVLPILSFLLLTTVALIFYIYYRQEVKVWLYSKNLCLWCVSEDELDEDKIYDIFISYSHKDEDFVVQNLLPVLESGPKPFKTCIHVRDWGPGEQIITHVTNSVLNSRRTLVVLSNSFLDSMWGNVEFEMAHLEALKEGRSRLIVVKYGELDEKKINNDLKAYLATNTYIEWGLPYFWNKLKYALPHSNKNSFYKSNQKHANVMLNIDDKFELTCPPLKHPESTPPVITLEPSLLNPLNFSNENEKTNRSSEVPLVINM